MSRVRSEFVNHANGHVLDSFEDGTASTGLIALPKAYERTTTDDVIPNFHKRSANGEIFNNPFVSEASWRSFSGSYRNQFWRELEDTGNWVMSQERTYDHGICEVAWASAPAISPVAPDLTGVSGNKALANVNATAFNAPLFVAEWSKTRALVPQIGELLAKTFRDLRKRKAGGFFPATSKNLANAWLLGRFGVTPLLYELQGACELLSKPRSSRATARGNADWSGTVTQAFDLGDSCGTWHLSKEVKLEISTRSGILYEGSDLPGGMLASVGATRPATVAWELVPWSFVIDRFVDISSWLDAIQPDGASKILSSWQGTKTTRTTTVTSTGFTPNSSYGTKQRASSLVVNASEVTIIKTRYPWSATAVLPSWNPTFNLKHLGDYASLVRQRIKSGSA